MHLFSFIYILNTLSQSNSSGINAAKSIRILKFLELKILRTNFSSNIFFSNKACLLLRLSITNLK